MGTCVHCKSTVPFNAPTCLVCEEPLAPQNTPHANIKLHPKIICVACGTGNPANLTTCVTCETKLPATGKVCKDESMGVGNVPNSMEWGVVGIKRTNFYISILSSFIHLVCNITQPFILASLLPPYKFIVMLIRLISMCIYIMFVANFYHS